MRRAAVAVAAAGLIGFGSVNSARAQEAGQLPALRGGSVAAMADRTVVFAGRGWRVVGDAPMPVRVHDLGGRVTLIESVLDIRNGWRGEANYADRDSRTISYCSSRDAFNAVYPVMARGAPVVQLPAGVVVPPQARPGMPAEQRPRYYNPNAGQGIGTAAMQDLQIRRDTEELKRAAKELEDAKAYQDRVTEQDVLWFSLGIAFLAAGAYSLGYTLNKTFGHFRKKIRWG